MKELLIGGFVVFAIGFLFLVLYVQRLNIRELAKVARESGLEFHSSGETLSLWRRRLAGSHLLSTGNGRFMQNVMVDDRNGVRIALFEYSYSIAGADFQHSIVALQSDAVDLPAFELRVEGMLDRVNSLLGSSEIKIAGYPDFSDNFVLLGEQEPAIRALFTQQLLDYLVRNKDLNVEGCEDTMIVYVAQQLFPENIDGLIGRALEVHARFTPAETTAGARPGSRR